MGLGLQSQGIGAQRLQEGELAPRSGQLGRGRGLIGLAGFHLFEGGLRTGAILVCRHVSGRLRALNFGRFDRGLRRVHLLHEQRHLALGRSDACVQFQRPGDDGLHRLPHGVRAVACGLGLRQIGLGQGHRLAARRRRDVRPIGLRRRQRGRRLVFLRQQQRAIQLDQVGALRHRHALGAVKRNNAAANLAGHVQHVGFDDARTLQGR